jgi:hypothetical protein
VLFTRARRSHCSWLALKNFQVLINIPINLQDINGDRRVITIERQVIQILTLTSCVEMENNLSRIGTNKFVNESKLDASVAFDIVYGGFYKFVYLPTSFPSQFVNGTWTGWLGHLMNDKLDWIE